MREIANHLSLGMVVRVDFGRQKIQMHNVFVVVRIPQSGMVFDHVLTERNYDIRRLDGAGHHIVCLQSDGEEAVVRVHVDLSLIHI